jgi:hypothetical protein
MAGLVNILIVRFGIYIFLLWRYTQKAITMVCSRRFASAKDKMALVNTDGIPLCLDWKVRQWLRLNMNTT